MWIETTRTRALLARLCNSAASQGVGTTRRVMRYHAIQLDFKLR